MSKANTAKQLRDKYGVKASENVSARVKEQRKTVKKITEAVSSNPKTISEISRELGIELRTTAWYVFTMTRHRNLKAVRKNEDGYWLYAPASSGGD